MTIVRGFNQSNVARVTTLALACVAALSSTALAQSFKPIGIKVGDGRLHFFADAEGRYDSLVGFFTGSAMVTQPTGDFLLVPRGGLKFELANDSTFISFNGYGEGVIYLGAFDIASRSLTRAQANVALDAHFNKTGAVEFQIGDSLTRSDRTQNAVAGVGIQSLFNEVRLAVPIHPGGRALEFTPRVAWAIELFEPLLPGNITGCPANNISCDPNLVSQMNYSNLTFGLNARWKFLPKTALVVDTNFAYRTYWNNSTDNPGAGVFRAQMGLVGLLTPRISVTLLAGYGGNWLGPVPMHTVIGQAEMAYLPNDITRLSIGYARTVNPTPLFGVLNNDRGYLSGGLGLAGGRVLLNATASVDYLTFYNNANRNDLIFAVTAGPTVEVTSWFQVGAGYNLSTRASFGPTYAGLQGVNFVRHEAFLRLTLRY